MFFLDTVRFSSLLFIGLVGFRPPTSLSLTSIAPVLLGITTKHIAIIRRNLEDVILNKIMMVKRSLHKGIMHRNLRNTEWNTDTAPKCTGNGPTVRGYYLVERDRLMSRGCRK